MTDAANPTDPPVQVQPAEPVVSIDDLPEGGDWTVAVAKKMFAQSDKAEKRDKQLGDAMLGIMTTGHFEPPAEPVKKPKDPTTAAPAAQATDGK